MTEQTARRVANEVCLVQLKATAMLVASGIDYERLRVHPVGDTGAGVDVDGVLAALVSWAEHAETVEIELTWADAWAHLRVEA